MENDSDQGGAKVSIMTLHAAKGLEFPVVFLPGGEDGLFPSQRSMDESGVKGLEEERRLAYVGITRAEEVCTISFASNRRVFGQWQSQLHSRFIDELPEEHVEIVGSNSVQGKGYGGAPASVRANGADPAGQAAVYNSPGWKRLQERSANPSVSQPSKRKSGGTIDMQAVASYMIGERVFHQKFGYGAVVAVDGDKVEVAFEKAGTKKVVSGFLNRPDDVPF
jgi:DNA helicase-2/ATP-dependent DNA helicase PcrA